jgi:Ca2+:H+ antiporter
MHRIKRQAKRNAWYTDDGSRNLNPFGKLWREGPRSGPADDLEAGPHRAQTEDEGVMSSAEDRRLSQWEDGENIHHAQTLPARPAGQRASQQSERAEGSETISPESKEAPPGLSDSTGAAAASEKRSTEDANGGAEIRHRDPKKRRMGGLLGKVGLGHKKEDDWSEEEEKDKKPKQKFTVWSQFQHTIFNSPINILLVLVPVGIAVAVTDTVTPGAIFTINFIAIIPLAGLLSFATEEIALRTGETLGGLLNATFG